MSLGLRRVLWIALGVSAVVLVALIVHLYLDRSPTRVNGGGGPGGFGTPVLVAKKLIPKGTPGALIASQPMYAATSLPMNEIRGRRDRRSLVDERSCDCRGHQSRTAVHHDHVRSTRVGVRTPKVTAAKR